MTGFLPVPPDPYVATATDGVTKLFPAATMAALHADAAAQILDPDSDEYAAIDTATAELAADSDTALGAALAGTIDSVVEESPVVAAKVEKDSIVVNVRDHGVTGNNTTDDLAAIEAIAATVSTAGGGTLYFPRGTYLVSRGIRCASNIRYQGESGAVIRNADTSSKAFELGAFMPGFIHGYGFYASNPSGSKFPRVAVSNVAEGATTVTCSTPGDFSAVSVGDFVAVRSSANYVASNAEIPNQLYFSKVYSKSGDTLTLLDASPYAITGAIVHPLIGNPTDGSPIAMFMVENVTIDGFGIDARFPVAGGGCYGFKMSNVRPVNRARFSSLASLNAIVNGEITRCVGHWYYTFVELALGSSSVRVHDNTGTWGTGAAVFHPINITESAHDIRIQDNRLFVPTTFNDNTKVGLNLTHCQDVWVTDNKLSMLGTIDCVFAIGSSTVSGREASSIHIKGNTITTSTGANRVFSVGATAATTIAPRKFFIEDNVMEGALNAAVNFWITITLGEDYRVRDNISTPGAGQSLGPATRGLFAHLAPSTSASSGTTQVALATQLPFSSASKSVGALPFRGVLSAVRVEIVTAFNGGSANQITVGDPALGASAFATAIDATVVGVTHIQPGHANAGTRLGKRESTAARTITGYFTYSGAVPTTGQAIITAYYEPLLPPAS